MDQEVLLETMKKQLVCWKLHQRTSPTWAFFKINDNKQVDLKQSQAVQCIACHRKIVGLKFWPCAQDATKASLLIINAMAYQP